MLEIGIDSTHTDVLAAINALGWPPGGRVDISQWLTPLTQEGYHVSPLVKRALSSLGGLIVEPVNSDGPNFSNDEPLNFDPMLTGSGQRELAQEVEVILDGIYFPIGE
ncbi:SUKH-3 domain-containing protein [Nonomuraea zeae]|uniref:Uncharacterized protein n=1 Tax=Nonomuraea zeae TaxID=1642303 RepID=A0A5S4GA84_9ACTN|nr:hypothetical protein ETD85_32395 [Nonomuraea zeae]